MEIIKKVKQKKRPLPLNNIKSREIINPFGLNDHAEVEIDGQNLHIAMKDLEFVEDLGKGSYGIVQKRRLVDSDRMFAVKIIRHMTGKQRDNRLLNDLTISVRCRKCPYIVSSYCAFYSGGDIWICMEVMDTSLDIFHRKIPEREFIEEPHLAYIMFCMVVALSFLHMELKVIHRDVKPSNVLLDRHGRVLLCDFGISGFLINSKAKTNVGSRLYLAPERIVNSNDEYTIRSDVWSLGVTLMEVASRMFPFPRVVSTIEQLTNVVACETMPTLPSEAPYSSIIRRFVSRCLVKDPMDRDKYEALLKHDLLVPLHDDFTRAEYQSLFADYVSKILDL